MKDRKIKPDFFRNEELAECDPLARILYAGLWCYSDRKGCFEWRPKKMWANILPYEPEKCLEFLLRQLLDKKLIIRYKENGKEYGYIPTFLKHQKPHVREKDSGIPIPSMKTQVCMQQYIYNNINTYNNSKKHAKFGEFKNVRLSEDQIEKLHEKIGPQTTEQYIEKLSNYMASKGKRYKSHYATILAWWRKDGGKLPAKAVRFDVCQHCNHCSDKVIKGKKCPICFEIA